MTGFTTSPSCTRRRFLLTTALAGTAAATLPATAFGFSLEPADAEASALYLNACSQSSYHTQLLADARAALAGKLPDAEIDAAMAQLACPLCGCPVG